MRHFVIVLSILSVFEKASCQARDFLSRSYLHTSISIVTSIGKAKVLYTSIFGSKQVFDTPRKYYLLTYYVQ